MEFDPTPQLKSSLKPILFFPFNNKEDKCFRCMTPYSKTLIYDQKYCKNCLFWYANAAENDIILDVLYISVPSRSQVLYTRNIKEWRDSCSEVLYFRQVSPGICSQIADKEKKCALCEEYYQQVSDSNLTFRLCPNCYKISSGWAESTPTIPTLSLPWWDTSIQCRVCQSIFRTSSNCQKLCSDCCTTYVGCRFCLSTEIIFGFTDKSRCKKCKRITHITNICSGTISAEEFFGPNNYQNSLQISSYVNYVNCVGRNTNLFGSVYDFLRHKIRYTPTIRWILYHEIKNFSKIAEGGFGMMCRATWSNTTVAIKRFRDPHQFTDFFIYKLKSIHLCRELAYNVMKCLAITQDPQTREYMLMMNYSREGDLHKYLQKNFANLKWLKKLHFLWEISRGLHSVHKNHFTHNDLHSGNIIISSSYECQIGDLGLSQPANITSSNDEIYGVIPYIAPEIFNGAAFSRGSDIYSFAMIMWEITSCCKPFANVEHNSDLIDRIIDGERPEITSDTPVCFANLMKRCWDPNPARRPSAQDISEVCYGWLARLLDVEVEQFDQAEERRAAMVLAGTVFAKGSHPGAIYTSRPLNSLIFKSKNYKMNQERRSIQEIFRTLPNVPNAPENDQDINKNCSEVREILEAQYPTNPTNPTNPINDTPINNSEEVIMVESDGDGDGDGDGDDLYNDDYYSSEDERLLAEELKSKYRRKI